MKAIEFKHQNIVFAKDQPEYQPLPALRLDTPEGEVISCWKLSFKERLKIVFTGCVWLSLLSFNKPLTPSYMSVNRKDVYSHPDDENTLPKRIKKFFEDWKYIHQNDPLKKCQLFKDLGCSHVDGYLCDFPKCSMNLDYLKEKEI